MVLGSLVSVAHGFVLPIALLILAVITDTFQFHEASRVLSNLQLSVPLEFIVRIARESMGLGDGGNRIVEFYAIDGGYRPDTEGRATLELDIRNKTGGVVNCTKDLVFHVPFPYNYTFNFSIGEIMRSALGLERAHCLDNDEFIAEMNPLILGMVGVALVSMVLGSLQVLLFTIAAERQVKKARLFYFNSILKQEREWYDKHMAGELTTTLLE